MSKARITYRFESARRAAGQAAPETHAAESLEQRPLHSKKPIENEQPAARSNVIPLRHDEFQLTQEDTIVIEERHPLAKQPEIKEDTEDFHSEPETQQNRKDYTFLNSYSYDYGSWNHTENEEIDRLERLIRQTDFTPEADPEERRSSRSAVPPKRMYEEPEEVEEGIYHSPDAEGWQPRSQRYASGSVYPERRDGASWWKLGASLIGAVATGILFGSFVLNMFTGSAGDGSAAEPLQGEQSVPVTDVNNGGGGGDGSAGAIAETPEETAEQPPAQAAEASSFASISIPQRDLYLLQNGKFSTLDNARALSDEMKSKGLAATIEESGSFWVYAGVTSDRDAALRVSRQLQDNGIEVFIKKYNLPAVEQVRWAGDAEAQALGAYLTQGSTMVQMIGDLTLVHLDGEPTAPGKSTIDKVLSEHRSLTQLTADATAGLPADAQPMLKRMDAALSTAVTAVQEYAANPDQAYLWSAQSAIMDYVIAEKQLLTSIAWE